MSFRIETHVHTSQSSKCASLSAENQVKQYISAGYSGMVVTDHFVNGNTAVDKSAPWDVQMKQQFSGYDHALKAAEGTDFKVYLGTEYAYHGTEFLVIGLGRDWFTNHPDIVNEEPVDFLRIFMEAGAAVIQAHPYREAPYIKETRLFPDNVDAIEGYNLHNARNDWNEKAMELAKTHNKPVTAGSDCHHQDELGAGIELDVLPANEQELISIIKSGKGWRIFGDATNS